MTRRIILVLAGAALLHLSCAVLSENNADSETPTQPAPEEATSVTTESQWVSPAMMAALPQYGREYLLWPSPDDGAEREASGEKAEAAKTVSLDWIRKVLQEPWVPPDLGERLIALRDDVEMPDPEDQSKMIRCAAVRVRYKTQAYRIQVVQTSETMAVVIAPQEVPETRAATEEARRQLVSDTARLFLNKSAEINSWATLVTTSTEAATVGGVDYAAHPEALNRWYGMMHWCRDGAVVVFTLMKAEEDRPRLPPLLKNWF